MQNDFHIKLILKFNLYSHRLLYLPTMNTMFGAYSYFSMDIVANMTFSDGIEIHHFRQFIFNRKK